MAQHFLTILTGRNLPKIRHFTRVVEQTGILERKPLANKERQPKLPQPDPKGPFA
jgi:hypothetical protein